MAVQSANVANSVSREVAAETGRVVRGGLAPWQQRRIEVYVARSFESALRAQDLSRLVSLSASHFRRAFKASFGETPQAYILRMRVDRAKRLMLTTPESLSQVALACGFADQPHFCHCFRQLTGDSPGAWRRRERSLHGWSEALEFAA